MNTVEPPQHVVDRWKRRAYDAGVYAAETAATWVTDGNETNESRRYKLKLLEDCDPLAESYLPARPDLSGEWAGGWGVGDLIEEVTGEEPSAVPYDIREELINEWERGVDEEFERACWRELSRWVDV